MYHTYQSPSCPSPGSGALYGVSQAVFGHVCGINGSGTKLHGTTDTARVDARTRGKLYEVVPFL